MIDINTSATIHPFEPNNNRASDLYRLMKRRSYNPFGQQLQKGVIL